MKIGFHSRVQFYSATILLRSISFDRILLLICIVLLSSSDSIHRDTKERNDATRELAYVNLFARLDMSFSPPGSSPTRANGVNTIFWRRIKPFRGRQSTVRQKAALAITLIGMLALLIVVLALQHGANQAEEYT